MAIFSRQAAERIAQATVEIERRVRNPWPGHRGRWTRQPGLRRCVLLENLTACGSADARVWSFTKETIPPTRLTCDEAGHGDVCFSVYDTAGVVKANRLAVQDQAGQLYLPAGTLGYVWGFADSGQFELIAAGKCGGGSSSAAAEEASSSSAAAGCSYSGTVEVLKGLWRDGNNVCSDKYELTFEGGKLCTAELDEEVCVYACCPAPSSLGG